MKSAAAFPAADAQTPPEMPPIVAATLKALHAVGRIPKQAVMRKLQRYYDGTAYDEHPFSWDGSRIVDEDVLGATVAQPDEDDPMPPLNQRRPPAIYPIGRTAVDDITALLFGDGRFPELKVDDDPATEDFAEGVEIASGLVERFTYARAIGGATGEAYLSWGWTANGKPQIETHSAIGTLVFAWQDAQEAIPAHVLKAWATQQPGIDPTTGIFGMVDVWWAREWKARVGTQAGYEAVYRFTAAMPGATDSHSRWEQVERVDFDRDEDSVPIAWVHNVAELHDALDGRGDFEGMEGMIDTLNITLCATANGTAANADPTLCIPGVPKMDRPDVVRRGGYNVIYGDAKLLELSGGSVTAGLTTVDRLRALTFEGTHVAMLDPEKLSGAQSGEAMRRLFFRTTQYCDKLRTTWGRAIERVMLGLIRQAQRAERRPPPLVPVVDDRGLPIYDEQGQQTLVQASGVKFDVPPRVETTGSQTPDGKLAKAAPSLVERVPGKGTRIRLVWPQYFPDNAQDELAKITAIQAANGGRPVCSPRTSIEMAKPITKVEDADKELKDIVDGATQFADASAGSLGMMPPNGQNPPGGAGGEEGGEKDDGDENAAA